MTIKQLINKLKKMPEDATVCVYNDKAYEDGSYRVTSSDVAWYDDNTVIIGTDYKHMVDSWD